MMSRLRSLLALTAALMLCPATPAFAQQPVNVTQALGAPLSAANPLYTCIASFGGSQCITIPASQTQNFDTDGGTDVTEIVGIALPDPSGAVAVDGNHPLPVITTASSFISAVGNVTAIAHGTNPTAVAAGVVTPALANRARVL